MEPYTLEHIELKKIGHGLITEPEQLRYLVKEMEVAINMGPVIDYNTLKRFSFDKKNKLNPFGYEKRNNTKVTRSHYRRNSLCQKLIRIKKEFRFVKKHLQYYKELTTREKQIMQLIARGNNNPKIAEKLFISRYTVEQHRKHINNKLQLNSLPHLIKYANAFDLI